MIKVGDKVRCMFFNVPDNSYYGEEFTGEVIEISYKQFTQAYNTQKPYLVRRDNGLTFIWLHSNEVFLNL